MKIKKFFESSTEDDRLDIIKECFFNITDDYDVNVSFSKVNESYYRISIDMSGSMITYIGKDNIDKLNTLSDRYSLLSDIYKEIYVSVKRLEEHELSNFEVSSKTESKIVLNCYFNTEDIDEFITVDDYTIYYDKNKLKLFFNKNFNTIVTNSYLVEEEDRNGDYNIKLVIDCKNLENSEKIKEYMLSLKFTNGRGEGKIFRRYWNNSSYIELYTNWDINDYRN